MAHRVADDDPRKAAAVVKHDVWWAGIASRAHLPYGISWLRELLRREPGTISVHLLGTRSFFSGQHIEPAAIEALIADEAITVSAWDGHFAPKCSKLWMLSTGAVGIKPWLRLRAKHPLRCLTVVVTDEGLGTYGNWRSRYEAMERQGVREPWRFARATAVEYATKLLTTQRWPLHVETASGWGLNQPAADEFRRLAPDPDYGERVVFLSQPWPELGVLSEESYLRHVDELARITKTAGLQFVVLPHPGEAAGRHARYAPPDRADPTRLAELNPVALGARLLVGASSTAMLNLAAVHGIPAMRVGTPELLALDRKLAPRQASLLAQYAVANLTPLDFGRRLSQGLGR